MIVRFKLSYLIFLPASLCLLLCACQTGSTESIPTEPLIQAEKSPQQLLDEQPVDDTPDAFLVDTGGELGTLLVTTELEKTPIENCDITVHFSVWNPAAMDEPLQTLTTGTNLYQVHCYTIDANFDGYMDFTCRYMQGRNDYSEHLWIWDENYRQFKGVPEYDKISMPFLDGETKTIYGYNRTSVGGTGLRTFHQWVEGKLLCMRRIGIESIGQQNTVRMSIQDRVADELVEIYREDFSSESHGWLDAQMIWHDLDYHGAPGGIYDIFQQQPIDDFHDAFLVDTRGKLGTLLVTAELAAKGKNEFGTRDIAFSIWNPAEMEEPIQTLTEEVMMGVAPEFQDVVDANFDGFQDFGYLIYMGNQPTFWHYWLWNEEQEQFVYCAPLRKISSPVFDADRQVITSWARASAAGDGENTFHRWEDGELVCVRRINSSWSSWGDPTTVYVEDRIDGELQEVYYERFPWSDNEPEGREAWRQAEYLWFDLDYHGTP